MAILKIARMGHPILKGLAQPVEDPLDPKIHNLINDMIDTLTDLQAAGLAAPQVHVPLRLVIFQIPAYRLAAEDSPIDQAESAAWPEGIPLTILINPKIAILGPESLEGPEACLSVPGLAGIVPRYAHIRYSAWQPDGSLLEREANGFHARVVQHECDHLDGILYPQRMTDLATLGFVEEIRRYRPAEFAQGEEA